MQNLKNRAIKSVFYVTLANIISRVLNVVALLIAARLLSKDDIGTYGIISTIIMILLVVVSFGYDTWYQKSTSKEKYHYTAFVGVSVISTIIIAIALFYLAPTIGVYYHANDITLFARIIAIFFLVGGLTQLYSQHLAKHLEFRFTSISTVARQLTQAIVSMVLIFIYKDAMALIIGLVAGGIVEFVILFIKTRQVFLTALTDFSPVKLYNTVKKTWRLALSFMGSKVINTIARMAPPMIFGRTLGLADTGLFTTMDNFISQPLYLITGSISTVSLPVLAKVKKNHLASSSLKISKGLLLISAPLFILMWIFPTEIITLVLGSKWSDGANILQLLMIAVFINIAVSPISSVFAIRNQPHQLFYWNMALLVGNIASLIIGSRYGLLTAVMLYTIVNSLLRIILQIMTAKLLGEKPHYFIGIYFEYLKLWLPLVAICLLAKYFMSSVWIILPVILVILVVYYLLIRRLYPYIIREIRSYNSFFGRFLP